MLSIVSHDWCKKIDRRTHFVPLIELLSRTQSMFCEYAREFCLRLGLRWNAVPEVDRAKAILRVASENNPDIVAIDDIQGHNTEELTGRLLKPS